jgi:hypothetical protein
MKIKLKTIIFALVMLGIIGISSKVQAASASISATKTTATVGDSVTITVNINAATWNLKATGTGISGGKIVGYDPDENNTSTTKTYSLNTSSAGSYKISLTGDVTDGTTSVTSEIDTYVIVTINNPAPTTPTQPTTPTTPTKPTTPSNNGGGTTTKPSNNTTATQTKSSNSKLSSLQIAEGVITPEFNSNVREYAVMVPNEITKLSIAASQEHSRATVRIVGNEELQVGDNTVEIIVTAEDGSTSTYKIYATRALPELNLQTLSICYIDENNQKVELKLEPQFVFNTYEYKSLEKLSYTVKELQVDAIANRENAKVEIIGNKEIKAGKNEITIKVTLPNEEGLEEQKTYKITIEREDEPVIVPLTTMQKIKNWFSGVGASVGGWITANFDRIISGMLLIVAASFVGLTIYFAYDYKNYQRILAKLAEYNKENLNQRASVALNPEMANINENVEPIDIAKDETEIQETNEKPDEEPKAIKGRRFK